MNIMYQSCFLLCCIENFKTDKELCNILRDLICTKLQLHTKRGGGSYFSHSLIPLCSREGGGGHIPSHGATVPWWDCRLVISSDHPIIMLSYDHLIRDTTAHASVNQPSAFCCQLQQPSCYQPDNHQTNNK